MEADRTESWTHMKDCSVAWPPLCVFVCVCVCVCVCAWTLALLFEHATIRCVCVCVCVCVWVLGPLLFSLNMLPLCAVIRTHDMASKLYNYPR